MKTNTIYIEVPCSEPPKEKATYLTNLGLLNFYSDDKSWHDRWSQREPDWWLEKREDVIVMTEEEYESDINHYSAPIHKDFLR